MVSREIGFYDGTTTRAMDVTIAMANDELNTFMDVSQPVTGIVQERPSYSNIANGLGLFASRSSKTVMNIPFRSSGTQNQNANLKALKYGSYTQNLNFCDPNPNNAEYSCD